MSPFPKVAILTALQVEYQAVRRHLVRIKRGDYKGTTYEIGEFGSGSRRWNVVIALTGAGNSIAAVEAERVITFFEPDLVFFVGVAGGLKGVDLGDVVVASIIHNYERGKDGRGFKSRGDSNRPSHSLIQRANATQRSSSWHRRIKGNAAKRRPKAIVGPVAAGEKVISSHRASTCELLKRNFSDSVAVEMEGAGFLRATQINPSVQAIVVRGISDLLDDKSSADTAGWQEIASNHAAAFAFELISHYNVQVPATTETNDSGRSGRPNRSPEQDSRPRDISSMKIVIPENQRLVRLRSTRSLSPLMRSAPMHCGLLTSNDDPRDSEEAEEIGELLTFISDWIDVHAEVDAGDQVKMAFENNHLVSKLNERGLVIFYGTQNRKLVSGSDETNWPIFLLWIVRSSTLGEDVNALECEGATVDVLAVN